MTDRTGVEHDDEENWDDSLLIPSSSEEDQTPVTKGTASSKAQLQRQVKAQRKADLASKQDALLKTQAQDDLKRYRFLLSQTDLFRHFINPEKLGIPSEALEAMSPVKATTTGRGRKPAAAKDGNRRHRKTEKEEDAELIQSTQDDIVTSFDSSPPFIKGVMREYQVQGLNWMIQLYENGLNGILADEMGLGKSCQSISLLGYLKYYRNVPGPHLVIVPKSTLHNWRNEFNKWIPDFNAFIFHGDKDQRQNLIKDVILPGEFEVCITSFEVCMIEKAALRKIAWQFIVIDEAHRIKNENSILSQIIRLFHSKNRLLVTGTPLQNNLHELWALLNFLLPDIFKNSEDFDEWFKQEEKSDDDPSKAEGGVVAQLRKVLQPFLLRRLKSDVEHSLLPKKEINLYVGMSVLQRKWYQRILEKDIDTINVGAGSGREGKTRLMNIVMQLRKCCNHPYLFDGAEPGPPFTTDEHLVENAGKMVLLDKLLKRMKANGSRVLLFSQMSRMLDILEDYCQFREYEYCRIDGQTPHEERIAGIDAFNAPNSTKFIYLLTTRAGGLGINLATADVVVLYDSDWNPQVDLQAQDRAHRIGQTKQVYVFRFITEHAIEEKVIERAVQKLRLDQLVIQQGKVAQQNQNLTGQELLSMIQHGAENMFQSTESTIATEEDIEDILKKGEEKTMELHSKYSSVGLEELQRFSMDAAKGSSYQWEGEDYSNKKNKGFTWIQPAKRERKANYAVDDYFREAMRMNPLKSSQNASSASAPRPPKMRMIYDFQFYPMRLYELYDKEIYAYRKSVSYKVPVDNNHASTPEEVVAFEAAELERQQEQARIDQAEPLTEQEQEEKEVLLTQGFDQWNKRDFTVFIKACEKYGRTSLNEIAVEVGKPLSQVQEYSQVFWQRVQELNDAEKLLAQIEKGEQKLKRLQDTQAHLDWKLSRYRAPLLQLRFQYGQSKGRHYTEEEDRFLICTLAKIGFGEEEAYERLRDAIRRAPAFRFDWYLKSRSSVELQRRCQTLIGLIQKENGELEQLDENKKRKSGTGTPVTENQAKKSKVTVAVTAAAQKRK